MDFIIIHLFLNKINFVFVSTRHWDIHHKNVYAVYIMYLYKPFQQCPYLFIYTLLKLLIHSAANKIATLRYYAWLWKLNSFAKFFSVYKSLYADRKYFLNINFASKFFLINDFYIMVFRIKLFTPIFIIKWSLEQCNVHYDYFKWREYILYFWRSNDMIKTTTIITHFLGYGLL